ADVRKAVQRARAAEHPPARPLETAARATVLRLRPVGPVDRRAGQLGPAAGLVDGRVVRPAARLDHRDGDAGVDEPARDDRPARARADHDDVERPGAHAVRRESASIATATRMIAPRMKSWKYGLTPRRLKPLRMNSRKRTPSTVRQTAPRPP